MGAEGVPLSFAILYGTLLLRFARHAVVSSFLGQIHLRISCPPFILREIQNKNEGFATPDVCLSVRENRALQKEIKSNDHIFGTARVFCATAETRGSSIH